MGYTHYWKLTAHPKTPAMQMALKDMAKIVRHGQKAGVLAGWDGKGKPEIKDDLITFNGKGVNSYETFTFPPSPPTTHPDDGHSDRFTDFTKTGRAPYDIYVTACLAAAKDRLKDRMSLRSDGGVEDWEPGVDLATKILKRDLVVEIDK